MSNNKIILNGCLDQYKRENELKVNDSEIFELFTLTQVTKSSDLTFEDIKDSIVDGGNDGGIDSLIVLVDDVNLTTIDDLEDVKFTRKTTVKIMISQCKKENSFKELTIDRLLTTLPELFNLEKSEDALLVRFNSDLIDKSLLAREVWKKCLGGGGKLKVTYNYCSYAENIEINGAFNSKIEQLKKFSRNHFTGAEISYFNYSCEELLKLYQTHKDFRLSIKFRGPPLSASYHNYGIGYVGTVQLSDYKLFITDHDGSIREDLFESNVRHFQGLVDVNKKIKGTIEEANNEDFWWLNNGITIIASNPSLVDTTLSIDNVEIVNGLQTSYSIYNHHSGDINDSRSVLVKVIINENKPTIDHIIASTNSQNPVSPALLRATDKTQRELEIFFGNNGYYYDRRKSFYKNQNKPASKIFSIQTAAQAIESIIFENPYSARSKPTTLIKDDTTYNRIFNPENDFKAYLNCCLILKKTHDFWSEMTDPATKVKVSNFKLHLSRIAASFILSKANYSIGEINLMDLENYTEDLFNSSIQLLVTTIDLYQSEHTEANLINMAKAKGLTDKIIQALPSEFI